jgi:predicted transcriptional regulator
MNDIKKDHLEIIEKQEIFRDQLDNIHENTEILKESLYTCNGKSEESEYNVMEANKSFQDELVKIVESLNVVKEKKRIFI